MIFLDTGFVLALGSKRDENHQRVKEVLDAYRGRSLWDEVLTTNHVVGKTITAVRFKADPNNPDRSHQIAMDVGRATPTSASASTATRSTASSTA